MNFYSSKEIKGNYLISWSNNTLLKILWNIGSAHDRVYIIQSQSKATLQTSLKSNEWISITYFIETIYFYLINNKQFSNFDLAFLVCYGDNSYVGNTVFVVLLVLILTIYVTNNPPPKKKNIKNIPSPLHSHQKQKPKEKTPQKQNKTNTLKNP